MSLATSNRDGGRTNEAGHLRGVTKGFLGQVLSGLAVSQRGAGANMSVDVAIGDAIIQRSDGTYGHPAWNDAVYNQAISAADGSNPRRDVIVMYIDYGETPSTGVDNNTNGVVKIKSVSGTAAGSPSDPSDATIQSSVGSGNPYIKLARVRIAAGAISISNSSIDDLRQIAYAADGGGWCPLSAAWDTWQYSTWDNTNKLATITVPDSSVFTLGQKVRYWQTTGGWKYGFIVRLPSGTSIQVYQGHSNGYTLNNERIYLPAYSRDHAPDGFPRNPAIWTVQLKDTADRTQSSPINGTWYNLGSLSIGVPVGIWKLGYEVVVSYSRTGQTARSSVTLSTANNSESDSEFTGAGSYSLGSAQTQNLIYTVKKKKVVSVTSNTTYYLNARNMQSAADEIAFYGATMSPTMIRAVCAYL